MLHPIHIPLAADPVDRIAALLLKLERSPAPDLRLMPLAARHPDRVRAYVVATLDDGGREPFALDQAQLLARCLMAEGAYIEAGQHAEQIRRCIRDAQAMADRLVLS